MLDAAGKGAEVSIGGMADEAKKKNQGSVSPFEAFSKGLSAEDKKRIGDMTQVLRNMGSRSLKEVLEERFDVVYAEGCKITGTDETGILEAVEAASNSDVVILACGGNCGWVDVTGGEGKDRCTLELPGVQQKLLEAVAETGKPVVMILYGPGIFALPWACEHVSAMIQAWMPGQYAGKVVADVLDGTRNPGGKLTTTIPRSVGQTPVTYNHRRGSGFASKRTDAGSLIFSGGYVDQSDQPLFMFGHGLSYTTFLVDRFELESDQVPTDGQICVSCCVKNTGDREGDETVQLYYRTRGAHVIRPVKQLAGFKRISLKPGETKKILFTLKTSQLGYYNEDMRFVVEPVKMDLMIGTSADKILYEKELLLTGKTVEIMGRRSYSCQTEVSEVIVS